ARMREPRRSSERRLSKMEASRVMYCVSSTVRQLLYSTYCVMYSMCCQEEFSSFSYFYFCIFSRAVGRLFEGSRGRSAAGMARVSPELRLLGYTPYVFQRVWKLLILR